MPAHSHRRVILPRTRGRKKLSFALTPLADAMFQLLIFFMLSSSLQPYSLITLTPGAAQAAPTQAAPRTPGGAPTIWHLGAGTLRMGTETVPLDDVGTFLDRMRAQGSDALVIFSGGGATVQDIASLLNAVTLAHVGSVQIVSAQGG